MTEAKWARGESVLPVSPIWPVSPGWSQGGSGDVGILPSVYYPGKWAVSMAVVTSLTASLAPVTTLGIGLAPVTNLAVAITEGPQ